MKRTCTICKEDFYQIDKELVCWECEEQGQILEMIKGRINNVETHRLDIKALMGQVENIITEIEDLASACEDGDYELPNEDNY